MASSRITCPDCKSVLRPAKPVPDGKNVKCPKCGTSFTTPGLRDVVEPSRQKASGKKKASSKKKDKAAIKKADGASPPPKRHAAEDDDDGSGAIYSYIGQSAQAEEEDKPEIDYAPDMSIKDLRGPAQEAVVKPSNYMLLIGGLCCLANIFNICFMFWPMVFSESSVDWRKVLADHYKGKQDKNAVQRVEGLKEYKDIDKKDLEIVNEAEDEDRIWRFVYMGVFILLLIYNAIAIVGAVRMQNLESRRWGIASAIMLLFPMGSGGVSYLIFLVFSKTIGAWILEEMNMYYSIGLGSLFYLFAIFVGVWALRILMSQEVIDGFEYVAE